MKTETKINNLGYKVLYTSGQRNGNLSITGVLAINNRTERQTKVFKNITQLYNHLKPKPLC